MHIQPHMYRLDYTNQTISNNDELGESDPDGSITMDHHSIIVNSSQQRETFPLEIQVPKRQAMRGVRLNCHAANVPGRTQNSGDTLIYFEDRSAKKRAFQVHFPATSVKPVLDWRDLQMTTAVRFNEHSSTLLHFIEGFVQ